MRQKMGQIVEAARTLAFTQGEVSMLAKGVKIRRSKGNDLLIGHPTLVTSGEDFRDLASKGLIYVYSPEQLSTVFMFVKVDAGRSIFGRQKSVYASYLTKIQVDDWEAGPLFKSWGLAITSLGNAYREKGYR